MAELAGAKERSATLEERVLELENLVYHDPDTGLPIRRTFYTALRDAVQDADPTSGTRKLAVGILRLDRAYQRIRNTRDRNKVLLYRTAAIMTGLLGDVVYQSDRHDEFLIMIKSAPGLDSVEVLMDRVIDEISKPHEPPADDIAYSCHIGLAVFPEHGGEPDDLIGSARIALDSCEVLGLTKLFYTKQMGAEIRQNEVIEHEISRISQTGFDSFALVFQPFCDTAGHIVGAEALIRWQSPSLGRVSPARFIPIAEDTGEIRHIGHWTLFHALRSLKRFVDMGFPDLHVSVNLSPAQFKQHDLVDRISDVVSAVGLSGKSLKLELTEGSVMDDPDAAVRIMEKIRTLGIRLSIDDFGTGYSSLNYLASFPIDTLKIDKSFIDGVTNHENARQIVRAIISLAHNIRLESLAEGVETKEQLDFLTGEGCAYIQGYYFSAPVDADTFAGYLQDGAKLPKQAAKVPLS